MDYPLPLVTCLYHILRVIILGGLRATVSGNVVVMMASALLKPLVGLAGTESPHWLRRDGIITGIVIITGVAGT